MSMLPKIDFIYLSEPDMIKAGVTDMRACVDTMEAMFKLLYKGDYRMAGENNNSHGSMILFPDTSPHPNMPEATADRRLMAMPAYLGGEFGTCGVKWYGSNIANREIDLPRSILMFILTDTKTGAPLAIMSANLLSAYRTGAIPGVGARHLARKDSRTVGILGPGVMGKTSLSALLTACPQVNTLKVKGRGTRNLDLFVSWAQDTYPQLINFSVVDSAKDLVRDSDVVAYCSSGETGDPTQYPLVKRDWIRPGAFFAMPALGNFDDGVAGKDVRKVLDNTGLYQAWASEISPPAHNVNPLVGMKFMDMVGNGTLNMAELEDLGQIVAGDAPGRTNEDEIIMLSVGGMPVEDVAWATVIYRNAIANEIGVPLNLWEKPAMS